MEAKISGEDEMERESLKKGPYILIKKLTHTLFFLPVLHKSISTTDVKA